MLASALEEHRPMLERCFAWLQPGGVLLATVGHSAWTGTEKAWHGAPMYCSHADEETYLRWLDEIGFAVQWTRFIPEGDGGHTLILGRRPAAGWQDQAVDALAAEDERR